MSITVKEIAWLAGLMEGEGCFRNQRQTVNVMVGMTDEDVIAKAAKLFNRHYLNVAPRGTQNKPQFHVTFSGRHAASWMMTLYPLMGTRRKQRIRECLTAWYARPNKKYIENIACGHLDRPLGPKGKCWKCYERDRHKGRKQSPDVRRRYYQKNKAAINARTNAYRARKRRNPQDGLF